MVLSDREFFLSHLDRRIPAFAPIRSAAEAGNLAESRRLLAAYIRDAVEPEKLSEALHLPDPDKDEVIKKAELARRHYMVSCGIPYDFGDKPVDWMFNPTANQYREWPYQLNRHPEWISLARAFRLTGDRGYYEAFEEQFLGWIGQISRPEAGTCNRTLCWRTIECGIRQGISWPEVFHSFYPEMPDDVLIDWCKSVWEHGDVLAKEHVQTGNWLIMEMNGLSHISVLYPWFAESGEWYRTARDILDENLIAQVYPDGAQYELSTDYQYVTIINYIKPIRLFLAYGFEVSEATMETLRRMLHFYVRMMRPDGRTVNINDGSFFHVQRMLRQMEPLFDDDPVLRFAAGRGGQPPEETSYVFEYPGLAVLRTGWSANDTFVFFDGGEFGVAHHHEDKLSLTLYADGSQVLTEGNIYAYDSSEMRRYVLSTRSHNTVRVDDMDQNRKKNYRWDPDRISQKSDLKFHLSDAVDALRACYDEGYGAAAVSCAVHERSVYFVKKLTGLRPFLIVCDRFRAEAEHTFGVLWHLDAASAALDGNAVSAGGLHLLVSDPAAGLSLLRGVTSPKWQGWTADSAIQGDFRPIYCAEYQVNGREKRLVTVIYPDGGLPLSITAVEASGDVGDTALTLVLSDGRKIECSEQDWLPGV